MSGFKDIMIDKIENDFKESMNDCLMDSVADEIAEDYEKIVGGGICFECKEGANKVYQDNEGLYGLICLDCLQDVLMDKVICNSINL